MATKPTTREATRRATKRSTKARSTKATRTVETKQNVVPTHNEIARRAFEIWLGNGCPDGKALDHWCEAEARLVNGG